ncbi:acyl-CoA dehydrogenase family protein [Phenylobacterium sp. SCN 70-31]|uniref:acyl-CoA dehydrogenase family protein n=1 Tax=Phenylobacterium sp. SCN 70-31 TaxID=1660129 RepID=UPI000AD0457D|nr:acyl-CoA dehydrogenase family protein [Phenylobacterium sp. SCN 70-31]
MPSLTPEERTALQDAVTRLLADRSAEADVRRTMETEAGYDPVLWTQLAEMGVTGLIVDEAYGGAGAGPLELEAVMEAAGAALLCGPLLGSGVLAAEFLQRLDDADAKTRLLPGIAAGATIAAAALTGESGAWTPEGVAVTADGDALSGAASYVIHGQSADVLLVLARTPDGLGAFEVDSGAAGVTIHALPTFDHTLRLARIAFDAAPGRRLTGDAWAAAEAALRLALVGLAGEQAGGARRCLDFTVDYAKNRYQFGRAIGSFQAVKHMAADLLLETESAISAARNAAAKLAAAAPDADAAVSLAAFACADAYVKTTADAVQMHGGIAFTWAHPAHLYLRRARADAQLFGVSAAHRERFLTALGA